MEAGFCTIDAFKPQITDSSETKVNQLKFGGYYGLADKSISVIGNHIEFNRQLNHKLGLDIKLTSLAQSGNGISTFGISDIFLNIKYKAGEKTNLILGAKIPLTDANKSQNQLTLPMDYKASLGTFDLILGMGYRFKKIQWAIAIKQPLIQNNNTFNSEEYPKNSKLRAFQSTQKFIRKGDLMLRVSYPISLDPKLLFTPSILPIFHLGNDKFSTPNGLVKEIEGSSGMTFNSNLYLDYEIDEKSVVQLNFRFPSRVRSSRPDGTTRSFIFSLEYRIKF
ncbi:MAG: hypothetical protein O2878_04285 [Bacteroidetes bacterium]|nr:hypothetical protein [Bacteroidota bacterium]